MSADICPDEQFEVEILAALPSRCERVQMSVLPGSTARAVVVAAVSSQRLNLDDQFGDPAVVPLGVFGVLVDDDYTVQAEDRLELYRPLQQDPMERRRKVARATAAK